MHLKAAEDPGASYLLVPLSRRQSGLQPRPQAAALGLQPVPVQGQLGGAGLLLLQAVGEAGQLPLQLAGMLKSRRALRILEVNEQEGSLM